MILDPDFLDHWKTRLFIELMGDEMASNYILRLWFHCQLRRTTHFEGMTGQVLKAICRYPGDGENLKETMLRVGFIEVDGDCVSVPKWAEANAKMMSNWDNGKRGGRPRKPAKTSGKPKTENPTHNPTETHSKPEDRIGEDRIGEEKAHAPESEIEKVAAEMATEFQFRIPGRSRPMLPDLRANFLAKLSWLKANGRTETEHIWRCIRDPTRDATEVTTINQMFKFWKRCGLEETTNAGSSKRPSVPGGDAWGDAGKYNGSRTKTLTFGSAEAGAPSPVQPAVQAG